MTPDRQLLQRYADTLARVTYPFLLDGTARECRDILNATNTPEMRRIYEANRLRLAGQSSPAECTEAVRKVIENA